MKLHYLGIFMTLTIANTAMAELPTPTQSSNGELISAQQLSLSNTARNQLQKRLEHAVFTMNAEQNRIHSLAESKASFDGAVVAVTPEAVKDIISEKDIKEEPPAPETNRQSHSMFDRGLDRASSHFAPKTEAAPKWTSERQFFLTTADWLTLSESFEINVFGKKVKARLDYRDNAQNVAVLSIPGQSQIEPVEIYNADEPTPSLIFVLLNPGSMYENLTQHVLNVTQDHLYGKTNLTARNGYPLFTASGQLAGLVVGPDVSHTNASVVHTKVLDRALHPQKYDRTKVEEIKLTEY